MDYLTGIPPFKPISNVTPFTYRDGETYLTLLETVRGNVNVTIDGVNASIDAANLAGETANAAVDLAGGAQLAAEDAAAAARRAELLLDAPAKTVLDTIMGGDVANLAGRASTVELGLSSLATTRTNLCPNPSFENGVDGWVSGSQLTLSRSQSIPAKNGSYVMECKSPNAQPDPASTAYVYFGVGASTNHMLVTPEKPIYGSVWVYSTVARTFRVTIEQIDVSNVTVNVYRGSIIDVPAETWTRISGNTTAISNAYRCVIRLTATSVPIMAGEVFYVDSVLVETQATDGKFFDGSDGRWAGAPGASASVLESVNKRFVSLRDNAPVNVANYGTPALAVAAAAGKDLYWSAGNVVADTNLPGFWDVRRHYGPGTITANGVTVPLDGFSTDTLTIYTHGTNGNTTNDGLSPSRPVTLAKTADILQKIGNTYRGNIVIKLAGTYMGGQSYPYVPNTVKGIAWEGEPLVAGSPVTKINYYAGATSPEFGLRFDPCEAKVTVRNIAFNNFTVGFNGYGVLAKAGGSLIVEDCTANNCDFGFAAIRNVSFTMSRCVATNCPSAGFMAQYSASGTFSASRATNCRRGFYATRNAVVHVDDSTAEDSSYAGLSADMAARINPLRSTFKRNAYGVRVEGAAEWVDEECVFGSGADKNTVPIAHFGVSRETRQHSQQSVNDYKIGWSTTPKTITGTIADTLVYSGSAIGKLIPNIFAGDGKTFRCVVRGTMSGAGNSVLWLRSTTPTGGDTISLGSWTTSDSTDFEWEVVVRSTDTVGTLSRFWKAILGGTVQPKINRNGTVTFDHTAERWFRLNVTNSDVARSVTIDSIDFYFSG